MFADYHVHTEFSDDSVYPMEEVIQDAARIGMNEICITDHVDYGIKDDWDSGRKIRYRGSEPLANVDYPRYMTEIRKMQLLYGDKITVRAGMEFLKILIEDGKGIEVNTSSHRYGLKDSTPSRNILKLYRDLGGRIITIGSDSHSPGQLGAYISDAREMLKSLGFRQFCTFERMRPVFHEL